MYCIAFEIQGPIFVSAANPSWNDLASRVIRVALERKGLSYAELADTLTSIGVKETERALISRVARGSVKLTLLLQIIYVTHALPPRPWIDAVRAEGPWEARARAVISAELAGKPWITPLRLTALLADIGTTISEKALVSQLSSGSLPLSFFLQCLVVLGSTSLDRYIDFSDLVSATTPASQPHKNPAA